MTRRNDRVRTRMLGWVFVLLALLGQVAGAAALPECCQGAPLLGEICSADHSAPAPASPHHRQPDCAVCPHCAALAMHAVVMHPAPSLRVPPLAPAVRIALPPPRRAPPAAPYRPGEPRGPPALT